MTTQGAAEGELSAPAPAAGRPTAPAPGPAGVATAPTTPRAGLGDRALVLITAAVTLPQLWMGYGTDIDVTDVITSAETIRRGDYVPSRPPGVPVFEALVAVLDPVGGHLLVNLATAAVTAAAVVCLARLVRAWGRPNGDLVALAFLASPIALVAGASTGDFMWAMAFFLGGALAQVRGRTGWAPVLFALAIGTRLSSALLIVAFLAAVAWDPDQRRPAARTALAALPAGALLYLPGWLAYDRSHELFETAEGWRSFGNNLGRFVYKNYFTAGGVLVVVLAVAVPALIAALRRWDDDPMLRVGVAGLAVSEALYFVLPWKFTHLLPALAMLLLWLAASHRNTRRFLWVVVAACAVNGLVTFRPLVPDTPHVARAGVWDPALTVGLLVQDVDCRLDAMRKPLAPFNGDAWPCSLQPMQGPVDG
ncbi:MAG TPA: hypothetical protein VFI47_12450 [Acidimicrobiales bacterium]|nr:hypothetical protein [Acidimicrobiales bacterium]